jgi:tetratricopeptide (TPR) repeat protein
MLHTFWILLAGINLADYFLIGYIWGKADRVWEFIRPYVDYIAGPAVTGQTSIEAFIEPELLVQMVRLTNAALAILGGLVALGVFLRIAWAHRLGLGLIAVQLALSVVMFALGFLGTLMALIRGVFILLLTSFMFQTVDDYSKEEHRERLELDRHALNDTDYYTRGRAYEKRGMWAKALLHWQRAVVLNPDRDTYFAAIARAYAHLGYYEQALQNIDEAIRISRSPEEWQPLKEIIVTAL